MSYPQTMARRPVIILATLAALNAALVGIPIWIVRPFIYQTPAQLALSHRLREIGPIVTTVSGMIAVVLLIASWRSLNRNRRIGSVLLLIPLAAASVMARVNYFEWVFAPSKEIRIAPVADLAGVAPNDMVIGVIIGGQSRAYPVRLLAYHHLLNDRIGATPLLPNY